VSEGGREGQGRRGMARQQQHICSSRCKAASRRLHQQPRAAAEASGGLRVTSGRVQTPCFIAGRQQLLQVYNKHSLAAQSATQICVVQQPPQAHIPVPACGSLAAAHKKEGLHAAKDTACFRAIKCQSRHVCWNPDRRVHSSAPAGPCWSRTSCCACLHSTGPRTGHAFEKK
jgi:hypothetical protein